MKKEIIVQEKDINVSDIVKMGDGAPVELQVAAWCILKDTIEKLKDNVSQLTTVCGAVEGRVTSKKYEDVMKRLVDEGKIWSVDDKAVFKVTTKDGGVINVSMSAGVDKRFEIDPALSAKSTMDIIPEKYKKVSVTLDKAAIEGDYDEGLLPDLLKSYCNKAPVDIIKLRRTKEKK